MNNDSGSLILYIGLVILSIAIGEMTQAAVGFTVLGGGMMAIGLVAVMLTYLHNSKDE